MMEAKTKEQKIREVRNEYARQWRRKNPEKVREYMDRYWLRKFEEKHKDDGKSV